MNNSTVKNFNAVPATRRPRTRFTPKGTVKTSFNAGKLVPIVVREVLPNTTMRLDMSAVVRGITPLAPVLDNAYLDVFAFFVPNRLVWEHWEDFLSEPTPEAYETAPQYSVPTVGWEEGSSATYQAVVANTFWDYAGVGAASGDTVVNSSSGFPRLSALYPRGYVKIWNDWFRDQNTQDYAHMYRDDVDRYIPSSSNHDPLVTAEFGKDLLPVAKYKDYFTSALPQAQKGLPVSIPLGDTAPVVADGAIMHNMNGGIRLSDNEFIGAGSSRPILFGNAASSPNVVNGNLLQAFASPSSATGLIQSLNWSNLVTDLSSASAVTVNALRLAFQAQRFQEKLARSGSRYTELLRSMFGIYASDSRLQRSEYLGGRRFPITQHQVAQTAENDGSQTIGLGDTGAFVFASDDSHRLVYRSFPEHGMLFILACVRTDQTYSQGVPVQFTRLNRFDYYFPVFAHIGEQPIKRQEIYAVGDAESNGFTFGYKEPWVEYKYMENHVTSKMRPYVNSNFGIWSYANNFASPPVISPSFIVQDTANIDRTLAVQSTVQDQFFADFYFDFKALDLPMPMYNVPGLIDHD